jgi:putative transposase
MMVPEGCEIRGFMIRLYPTPEQVAELMAPQAALRLCWNWLCKQTDEVLEATRCQAVREGLVPDPGHRTRRGLPCFPPVDFGLANGVQSDTCNEGMAPDEAHAAKEARSAMIAAWHESLFEATKGKIAWRPRLRDMARDYGLKQDYQMLIKRLDWEDEARAERGDPPIVRPKQLAWSLQALVKNYYAKSTGAKRKKPRRSFDMMPVQVCSGTCLEIGGRVPTCIGVDVRPQAFGTRRGAPFYDALVKINGLRIMGRMPGRMPAGRVLDGVAVTKQADGWWASVKVEMPKRVLAPPTPGKIVGIDVGLKYAIAAFDDGTLVRNAREASFTAEIARIKSEGDRGDEAAQRDANERIARMHQKQAKHMRHVVYNEVVAKCADAEVIRIEKLCPKIGQMGTRHMSVMRLVRSMLVERYGDRVQEVDPRYTSQVCSDCGHLDKEAWGHEGGPIRTCPQCGFRCHRDVNAARNIARGGVMAKVKGPLATHENKRNAPMPKAAE